VDPGVPDEIGQEGIHADPVPFQFDDFVEFVEEGDELPALRVHRPDVGAEAVLPLVKSHIHLLSKKNGFTAFTSASSACYGKRYLNAF
jgi:hypothetical protein